MRRLDSGFSAGKAAANVVLSALVSNLLALEFFEILLPLGQFHNARVRRGKGGGLLVNAGLA